MHPQRNSLMQHIYTYIYIYIHYMCMYILCSLSCLLIFLFSLNLLFICSSFTDSITNVFIQRRGLILSLNNPSLLEWDDKYKPATSNNDAFQDFLGFVKRVHQHQESDRNFFKSFNLANLGDLAVLSKKRQTSLFPLLKQRWERMPRS